MMQISDFTQNVAATPMDALFQDGLMEIGIGVEDLEEGGFDLFKPDTYLPTVGKILTAPIEAIGAVASGHPEQAIGKFLDPGGIFSGGGQRPAAGAPGGIAGSISQGVGQALGLGGAGGPLGSLFGAGVGGTMPGTGPLPGVLGQAATNLFGQPNLPPRVDTLPTAAYNELAQHTEKAGRAIVRRILGATTPELRNIRQLLAQRRNQIQATAEHRQLNAAADAHREVLGYLGAIASGTNWKKY